MTLCDINNGTMHLYEKDLKKIERNEYILEIF